MQLLKKLEAISDAVAVIQEDCAKQIQDAAVMMAGQITPDSKTMRSRFTTMWNGPQVDLSMLEDAAGWEARSKYLFKKPGFMKAGAETESMRDIQLARKLSIIRSRWATTIRMPTSGIMVHRNKALRQEPIWSTKGQRWNKKTPVFGGARYGLKYLNVFFNHPHDVNYIQKRLTGFETYDMQRIQEASDKFQISPSGRRMAKISRWFVPVAGREHRQSVRKLDTHGLRTIAYQTIQGRDLLMSATLLAKTDMQRTFKNGLENYLRS